MRVITLLISIIVSLQIMAQNASLDYYKIGDSYYDKGDYSNSYKWFLKAALKGNFDAMMRIGNEYMSGDIFPKDEQKAEYWFKEAIKNNPDDPWPYTMIAQLYYESKKDYSKAIQYSDMAIERIGDCSVEDQIWYYGKRGEIFVSKNDFANANKILDKCLELNPQYLEENEPFARMMIVSRKRYSNDTPDIASASFDEPIDTDSNIIINPVTNKNTFAIVIGNEKYKNEADVPFANNDSKVFCQYVEKTLGVPHNQIRLIENAGYNDIRIAVNWLVQAMLVCQGKGKAIVYYAGHGIPDESDLSAYLLPVDGIGNDPGSAYSLKDLYDKLGNVEAQSVTIFLDACFSGSRREGGMLASARGVALKAKPVIPKGSMVVFSAAQGNETAYPYKDKQHGMFTYFLLKKLQETKGNVALGELSDYLVKEVGRESFVRNGKMQTPTTTPSTKATNWRNWKLK